jgi:aminoglycoside/choline kinase family phosphotransferase
LDAGDPRPPIGVEGKLRGDDRLDCVALQRSFDATLLNWEFDHFREYLIEERDGVKMDARDKALFEAETRKVSDLILQIPYCFTHRDFQSRNLIVRGDGSLAIIDFQDALLGPVVYDLAALLRDSYVELEWGMVEELVRYYFQHNPPRPPLEKGGMTAFHFVTLQRKMKDAGRFVYIDRVKKNPDFLQYIPATLRYVKNAFERTGEFGELFEMLKKYVPEFK